jgi:hypothetical protein
VAVDNHPVRFQVDSGGDVNIIDEKTFSHITVVPIEVFRKMLTNSFPNLKEHL